MSNQPAIVLSDGTEVGLDTIQEWKTHLDDLLEQGTGFDPQKIPQSEAFFSLFSDLHDAISIPQQTLPANLLPKRPYHISAH